ncbi:hypothetical protein OAP56_03470 [Rickettsiaceae bacterium]|nr:hypothetical protein [Rickettsiaceae bacterium]
MNDYVKYTRFKKVTVSIGLYYSNIHISNSSNYYPTRYVIEQDNNLKNGQIKQPLGDVGISEASLL